MFFPGVSKARSPTSSPVNGARSLMVSRITVLDSRKNMKATRTTLWQKLLFGMPPLDFSAALRLPLLLLLAPFQQDLKE